MTRIQVYSQQAQRRINNAVKRLESTPFGGRRRSAPSSIPADRVRVLNTTGADLELGQVVELKNAIFPPDTQLEDFRDYVGMVAIVPTTGAGDSFGVVTSFIPDGEMGFVAIEGIHLAKVNMINAAHVWCNPTTSVDYLLSSGVEGKCGILDVEPLTGEKWAYVRLDRVQAEGGPAGPVVVNNFTTKTGGYNTAGTGGGESIELEQSGMTASTDIALDANEEDIIVTSAGWYFMSYTVNVGTGIKTWFNAGSIRRHPVSTWIAPAGQTFATDLAKQTMDALYAWDGTGHSIVAGGTDAVDMQRQQVCLSGGGIDLLGAGNIVNLKIECASNFDITAQIHLEYLGT